MTNATSASAAGTHSPLIPLAVLEAVRGLDAHVPDELDEVHQELAVKRLGQSATVAAQIERLHKQARRDEPVAAADLESLLKLVARRTDAGLVFTDAGRRVGRHLVADLPVPKALARLAGRRMARRAVRRIGVVLAPGRQPEATALDDLAVRATPDGAACALTGAAVAEVLRHLTDFDGAMVHVACRARGAEVCRWRPSAHDEEAA